VYALKFQLFWAKAAKRRYSPIVSQGIELALEKKVGSR